MEPARSRRHDVASFTFRFKSRSLALSCIGSSVFLLLLAAVGCLSGYVRPDTGWIATVLGAGIGVPLLYWWRLSRLWRRQVQSLGAIELDARGLRWRRPDTVAFSAEWPEVKQVIFDRPHRSVQIFLSERPPFLIQDAGFGAIDRFGELCSAFAERATCAEFDGRTLKKAGLRSLLLGAAALLVAACLYGANLLARQQLGWHRGTWSFPIFICAVGLLYLLAGVRIVMGRGTQLAATRMQQAPRQMLRFLGVAVCGNFAILLALNWLALRR